MRAAIYARFSSDLQNPKSADDQIDACRQYVERLGGTVVLTFKDEGVSAASAENRPQLQALLANAGSGVFDAVVVEAIDRLSRSVGDTDRIQKRLAFDRVKLLTIADGEANTITIGMRGISAALYLEDLKQKTKRGQVAALKAGKIAGGRCYGYDVAPGGKGERSINDAQAAVVRSIFADYAGGSSADDIVKALNAAGEPSPRGGRWRANSILGGVKGKTGVLRNELYRGVFVFNRREWLKSPDTGRRLARVNDDAGWLRQDIQHLRIVDDALWGRVQARLNKRSASHKAAVASRRMTRTAPRLLSGLLRCACCGGAMHIIRDDRVQCIEHRSGVCSNSRMASMHDIESRVVSAVRDKLLAPELIERALAAARDELVRLRADENRKRRALEKELQDLTRELQAMLKAIKAETAPDTILVEMRAAERRKAEIEAAIAHTPEQCVELHPNALMRYRRMVDDLWSYVRRPQDAAPGREVSFRHGRSYERQGTRGAAANAASAREEGQEEARKAARVALRELVDRIEIAPDGPPFDKRGGGPVTVTVHGRLAALLVDDEHPGSVRRVELVAGIGFEPMTFRL